MTKRHPLESIACFSTATPDRTQEDEGVVVERRRLLWLPAAALAAFALGSPKQYLAGARSAVVEEEGIGWDDFIKQCVPVSSELHRDSSARGQDAYLYWLASMAVRLRPKTVPAARLFKFAELSPPVEFGVGYKGTPFFVVEWRMAPHAVLPPHCHPNASVCTLGLEGETRIRNFQLVGDAPEFTSARSFLVRETHSEIVTPGRVNTLSAARDNIHTFQVGKDGARGIDISTYHGPDIGFSFLDIRDKAAGDERRIYEAVWRKLG
jgi:hypothetical protein